MNFLSEVGWRSRPEDKGVPPLPSPPPQESPLVLPGMKLEDCIVMSECDMVAQSFAQAWEARLTDQLAPPLIGLTSILPPRNWSLTR